MALAESVSQGCGRHAHHLRRLGVGRQLRCARSREGHRWVPRRWRIAQARLHKDHQLCLKEGLILGLGALERLLIRTENEYPGSSSAAVGLQMIILCDRLKDRKPVQSFRDSSVASLIASAEDLGKASSAGRSILDIFDGEL